VRFIVGLGVAQLELATAALASMNLITQISWWQKPLGVEVPIRVVLPRRLTDREECGGAKPLTPHKNSVTVGSHFHSEIPNSKPAFPKYVNASGVKIFRYECS